jgi:putative protease
MSLDIDLQPSAEGRGSAPHRAFRPEILAPAGDWECARAAVENGADAIYFGLERFNARMRAKNFTQADLPQLMAFLHGRGVKGYVTFNTLVFADEWNDAEACLRGIIAAGVDAAIMQDIGICRLIRSLSPDFPIHASTQMTVTSAEGVRFARKLGAHLVVLARENSIADIAKIKASLDERGEALPLEVFVHGALCVAYSGQCLTSESLGGRSANRGECAQACRLPYELVSDGANVDLGDRRYLLSPRDLAGMEVLPDLVRAGVASLKIEGRLKSPEYVASITRVYRQALNRVMAEAGGGGASPFDPSLERYELEMSFSRGLHPGWFRGTDNQALVHARFGTKRGVYLGEILRVSDESVSLRPAAPLKPGDGVVFDAGRPEDGEEGGRIYEIRPAADSSEEVILRFGDGDIDWRRVSAGQRLWKTNDPALDRKVRSTFAGDAIRFRRPVRMEVHGRAGEPLVVIVDDGEGHVVKKASAVPLAPATSQPLTRERLAEQLGRLGGTPFELGELTCCIEGGVILPVSELNKIRRESVAALDELRRRPKRWRLAPSRAGALSQMPPSRSAGLRRDQGMDPGSDGVARSSEFGGGAREARASVESGNDFSVAPAELIVVIRLPEQLQPAWDSGARTIYCEFENPKSYRDAVARFKELDRRDAASERPLAAGDAKAAGASPGFGAPPAATIWVAPPRVFKPGEEWILKQVRSCDADGYLVRNYDHLEFFSGERRRGDFSLNVANRGTAEVFVREFGLERVTASYDLNFPQLEALLRSAPPAWFDITIHQRMPMFHMEHCVFCSFLSAGRDYRDCGRPCESHRVELRDRTGALLPLKADAGCRNTVFNNRAQTGAEYVGRMRELGARSFRVEFVNETAEDVARTVRSYAKLLRGEVSGSDLWRELKLLNQLGVTRGQMEGGRIRG